MAGLTCIPVQFQQEEFRFPSKNRTVTRIQTIACFVGQEWTITRKIGPRETNVGRFGTSKRCKLKSHTRPKESGNRGTVFHFIFIITNKELIHRKTNNIETYW